MVPRHLETPPRAIRALTERRQALHAARSCNVEPVRITWKPNTADFAVGWIVRRVCGHGIFYHDGGKQGYRSVVAFDPKRRLGVVVLSNARSDESMPAWSRYLLTGEPLPPGATLERLLCAWTADGSRVPGATAKALRREPCLSTRSASLVFDAGPLKSL